MADCLLNKKDYAAILQAYARRYPDRGYGGFFSAWAVDPNPRPYNSYGNGSAMRVSPVGFFYDKLDKVLSEAARSAEVTHNHPEGIKGAQAVAAAIFLARTGKDKPGIRKYIQRQFGYDLSRRLDDIRPAYKFDETCQGSVPEAIIAFLESKDYEDAIRKAIWLGGDSDTIACMAGGIAQAFYKRIDPAIVSETRKRLTPDLLEVLDRFEERCPAARVG